MLFEKLLLASLGLDSDSLTGSIPSQIGQLVSLTYLELVYNNALTGSIPSEIGLLTSLRDLRLYNNSLTAGIILSSSMCAGGGSASIDYEKITVCSCCKCV